MRVYLSCCAFLLICIVLGAHLDHLDLDDNTITLGSEHACALERVDEQSAGGEIVCWGDNSYGQLDPPSGLFVQLSASEHTTCAVSVEERVWCWGREGGVVEPARAAAAALSSHSAASTASSPSSHTMLHGGGSRVEDTLAPSALALWRGALLQVSVGARHACAVGSSDGRLVCWGEDDHGQVTQGMALGGGGGCGCR
jgi:hypothetical protein